MKPILKLTIFGIILSFSTLFAEEGAKPINKKEALKKHQSGAEKLSLEQDDLSADIQDLIDEQIHAEVIKMLKEIEVTMADATDLLEQSDTGGMTIAIETEIIEKIFEAAKKKQQKSGKSSQKSQKSMGSMLQMMQNMMNGGEDVGKEPKQGKSAGEGGGGGNGEGSASGKTDTLDNNTSNEQRTVPKNSGKAGSSVPREFQKAMDAYNKGVQNQNKTP